MDLSKKCVIAQFIAIIFADKTNTIEDNKKDNKSTHVSIMNYLSSSMNINVYFFVKHDFGFVE